MKILKIVGIILGSFVGLVVIAIVVMNIAASQRIEKKFAIPAIAIPIIPTDSASIERGRKIATSVSNCVECHGEDLGGQVFFEAGPIGKGAGPNLTSGPGGKAATFTDTDFIRAIRYGIRKDSTSLLIMPSETFAYMTDKDLAALIAYIRQVPPVDRDVGGVTLGPIGKVMLMTGVMNMLVAEHTPRPERVDVPEGVTVEYGKYLASISGCHGCHGPDLKGGTPGGPPDAPLPANLTPAGNIGKWTDTQFLAAMREGKRPDGTVISDFMPWKVFGRMTNDELRAILLYLRSMPPMESAVKKGE